MLRLRSTPRVFPALGLALLSGLILCPRSAAAEENVKVGIVLPLSGSQAFFGEMEKSSFLLAAEEINAAGGVRGAELEFLFADDKGRPENGVAAAESLIGQGVAMLGGGYSSAVTLAVAEAAQGKGIPFLINTAAADAITEQGWDHVFRLNPPSRAYVAGAMSFLTEVVKPRSAAIIHEETAYGRSQSEAFEAACEDAGIPVVVHESYSPQDFKLWRITNILLKVKRAKPEVVYMASYLMDANLLTTQARALSWQPKAYVGGGAGFTLPEYYKLTGRDAEGVFTVTLWDRTLPYPRADVYYAKAEARYDLKPDYHGAEAYAAAYVIADALGRAESLEAGDVRRALAKTDMTTVFGPVKFGSYGGMTNQNKLTAYVGQWLDGELELVWPPAVAPPDPEGWPRYVYPTPEG